MVLTALSSDARPDERWMPPEQLVRVLEGFNQTAAFHGSDFATERGCRSAPVTPVGPSSAGTTWNGALAVPFWIDPGDVATITFVVNWQFPNRCLNFDPFSQTRSVGRSRFWVGNAYGARFADAIDVAEHVVRHREQLDGNPVDREVERAGDRLVIRFATPATVRPTAPA